MLARRRGHQGHGTVPELVRHLRHLPQRRRRRRLLQRLLLFSHLITCVKGPSRGGGGLGVDVPSDGAVRDVLLDDVQHLADRRFLSFRRRQQVFFFVVDDEDLAGPPPVASSSSLDFVEDVQGDVPGVGVVVGEEGEGRRLGPRAPAREVPRMWCLLVVEEALAGEEPGAEAEVGDAAREALREARGGVGEDVVQEAHPVVRAANKGPPEGHPQGPPRAGRRVAEDAVLQKSPAEGLPRREGTAPRRLLDDLQVEHLLAREEPTLRKVNRALLVGGRRRRRPSGVVLRSVLFVARAQAVVVGALDDGTRTFIVVRRREGEVFVLEDVEGAAELVRCGGDEEGADVGLDLRDAAGQASVDSGLRRELGEARVVVEDDGHDAEADDVALESLVGDLGTAFLDVEQGPHERRRHRVGEHRKNHVRSEPRVRRELRDFVVAADAEALLADPHQHLRPIELVLLGAKGRRHARERVGARPDSSDRPRPVTRRRRQPLAAEHPQRSLPSSSSSRRRRRQRKRRLLGVVVVVVVLSRRLLKKKWPPRPALRRGLGGRAAPPRSPEEGREVAEGPRGVPLVHGRFLEPLRHEELEVSAVRVEWHARKAGHREGRKNIREVPCHPRQGRPLARGPGLVDLDEDPLEAAFEVSQAHALDATSFKVPGPKRRLQSANARQRRTFVPKLGVLL
mmetsp:Transcript_3429/g.11259  ORF Transcript_3429/g.11259 Transcript_3429/m.11259 type:complete len:681 (-) Transcript_3429:880-2922(-)